MADVTPLRVGGSAARFVDATDDEEVLAEVRDADSHGRPLLVMGSGSNLLVGDDGFPGTVLRISTRGLEEDGDVVRAAAGEDWDEFVARMVAEGRSGVETLAGIPGRVGATPVQNVGAYGQDVSETVVSVRAFDRSRDAVITLTDCGFAYRSSRFKVEAPQWVVLSVTYRLTRSAQSRPVRYAELAGALGIEVGGTAPLPDVRDAVLSLRRNKGMVLDPADPDTRSAGSFFTNPLLTRRQLDAVRARGVEPPTYPERDGRVKVPAAWLIEQAGFSRGDFDGPAGISSKHALALVNRGGAHTEDLIRVARAVRDGVRAAFGVELVPEPVLVGVSL
jgi:UDP-N-acetylmuramate dehydrogenase